VQSSVRAERVIGLVDLGSFSSMNDCLDSILCDTPNKQDPCKSHPFHIMLSFARALVLFLSFFGATAFVGAAPSQKQEYNAVDFKANKVKGDDFVNPSFVHLKDDKSWIKWNVNLTTGGQSNLGLFAFQHDSNYDGHSFGGSKCHRYSRLSSYWME
jgi:hypothetical protein